MAAFNPVDFGKAERVPVSKKGIASEKDLHQKVWDTSLRMLASSPKSRYELKKKLVHKGYPFSTIEKALDQLENHKLLNDKQYAEDLFSRFQSSHPSGREKIIFELKRRGIAPSIWEEILEGYGKEEEMGAARELGRRCWSLFSGLSPLKRRKKVYERLLRRGFGFQTADEITAEFMHEEKS